MFYRSRRLPFVCAAVAALAIALPACGGGDGEGSGDRAGTVAGVSASPQAEGTEPGAAPVPAAPNAELGEGRCQSQLAGFLGSMDRLRDALVVGVTYKQYVAELKAVRGAYERLPVKRLGFACIGDAGDPAERGFNEYIVAGNAWGDCV